MITKFEIKTGQILELRRSERLKVRRSRIRVLGLWGAVSALVSNVYTRRVRVARLIRLQQLYKPMPLYDHEGHEVPQP